MFQDLFTRWVEVSPIRKANAKAVIAELNRKIFLRYGCPEVFLSDNGTEFNNHVVEGFLRERGVHHTHTHPYHPQANPVERANRTLKTMVASYLKERHSTWDEKLPDLLFALNTAEQSSTGVSSAILLYGRQPEPPGTQRRLQEVAADTPAQEESLARWKERMRALPELYERATARARAAQERQAGYYDAGRREPSLKPGDRVWKRSHPLSSAAKGIAAKLAPKVEGPHWITDALGSNTYQLVGNGGQVEEVVAADQLKICHTESPKPAEPEAGNGEETAPRSETPVATPIEEELPKRRGRPPGARAEVVDPLEHNPTVPPAPTHQRRGPGRPRVARAVAVDPLGPNTAPPSVPSHPPRGRGRPRKAP